ncbi:MAG: rod shape-determining protein MreC [Eggerthellaceae bacterium]|nr:rod shape-determining protein MreC [Eggerthellaceae bacterium]
MPLNFKQDPSAMRPYLVLIVLLVISLVSVTMYAREGSSGLLHKVQGGVSSVFTPLKLVSATISAAEDSTSDSITDATQATTVTELTEENQELRQTIAELEEYRQEAQRLQELMNVADMYSMEGVTCRVLSRSTDAWNLVVTIDAGTSSGVRAGLPVIGSSGLVGQVISATDSTAEVRLLADPQTGIAAMIQSSRAEGILKGSFDGLLYLEDVSSSVDVQKGDVVITSGLGGGYYRGIIIGTVVKVDGNAGDDDRTIIVEPNASTGSLEEVMVVTAMNSEGAAAESSTTSSTSSSSSSSTSSSSSSE